MINVVRCVKPALWVPGSGKTTVGKLVASALQYPFLDADTLIETLAGSSVAEIFAQDGEEEFRNLESQVLQVGHQTTNYARTTP